MSSNRPDRQGISPQLDDDELAIIQYCRALKLGKEEALRRLGRPTPAPLLPPGQELTANLTEVSVEFSKSQADPITLSGHDDPN